MKLAELAPGTVFASDFRVVRRLSEGGMGVIYVAEQISTGRQRALKLMHPSLVGSPELRQKFTMEARVGAKVQSEHIVEVVAAGVDGDVPWLAMELLVGEDLSTLISRRGPLPKEDVVKILSQVCHGLSAAHAAGIVHRDLKPENVFLAEARRANESYTVKLLDFGIAKVVEAARGSNTGAIGSPLWMAPEQTERNAVIGPPTDIWALGLVAFTLLTAKIFWRSGEDPELGVSQFLRELVIEPIPAASERAAELGVAPLIPPGFDGWFGRCVVRPVDQRFPDVNQAYTALSHGLGVWTTGPQPQHGLGAPLTSGTGPITASSTAFATARTQIDDKPPGGGTAPMPTAEPEHAPAVVPVQGPSPGLLVAAGALLFVSLGGAGVYWLRSQRDVTRDPLPDAGAHTPALPMCQHGMVRVTGGDFKMGSSAGESSEQPEHVVTVPAFCLDATEVTVNEYAGCVTAKACAPPKPTADWPGIKPEERDAFSAYCNHARPDRRDHPINCISFEEASAYCKWTGKHVPTEEQWEFAARGTDGRPYPWGPVSPTSRKLNGCDDGCAKVARRAVEIIGPRLGGDDGWEGTSPAGSYAEGQSPFGAFDMAGNVAEWVDAPFCPYGQAACGTSARVTRGGSWMTDTPSSLRTTARAKASPDARVPDIGVRCAK
ncbi:MAG: bifunctional serine/threonine-protein kinase/formylglycine-generating enzyme family protein [Labilithrix sp.]